MSNLLYGYAADERIVAVQQKDDSTMRVYFRDPNAVRHEDARFYPFFFLADKKYLDGFAKSHWVKQLAGNAFYQYLCVFEEWGTLWEAIRHVLERYNRTALRKLESYTECDSLLLHADPVTQYLLQTGRTLFKRMSFEDIHRVQLDIETYSSVSHRFSSASRPGDRIILISLSDNRGWKHMIDGKKLSEREMLLDLVRLIQEKDPDVIEGHNIYNFDLPYILRRCELHEVGLAIGRESALPRSFDTRTSFAERSFEYTITDIPGRHVIDTLILVQNYDMVKRNMESYGLKYAAKFFGFASPDRTYIPGDRISWYWDHDPKSLMEYAFDDVEETRKLSDHLSGSAFYLTQMLPFHYSHTARSGAASKIESLMVREYLRQKHSIPKPLEGIQTGGGYTNIFVTGVLGPPILHADVESLYPSIMINNGIAPASDTLNVFGELLKELTALRIDTKRKMTSSQEAGEKSRLDAMQSSFKILINSFYGYLGYGRALFNDFSQADEVTRTGQHMLHTMIDMIQSGGGKVIEVDTDGLFFIPPAGVRGKESEEQFVQELSDRMPAGITIALDGRYRKMFSYKKKNYALLGYDDMIKVKGSSLISRSMERFGRTFIHQAIDLLFNGNIDGLHRLYADVYNRICSHELQVEEFSRTETLKEPLAEYTREVEAGKRNKSAAYEIALASGRPLKPGERIRYYITGSDPSPRSFDNCKPIEEWNPSFPDENVPFYLRRLDEFAEKFGNFFRPRDFRAIFSADDLFPFSAEGIAVVEKEVEETAGQEEDAPGE